MRRTYIPSSIKLYHHRPETDPGEEPWPIYVANARDNRQCTRAITGASHSISWRWMSEHDNQRPPLITISRENIPIGGIRFLKMSTWGQSHRIWWVTLSGGFKAKVNEYSILESLSTYGVDPGGTLRGEFVFARTRTDMELVRVGSELWRELSDNLEPHLIRNIPARQLTLGCWYKDRNENSLQFLGTIYTAGVTTVHEPYGEATRWGHRSIRRRPSSVLSPRKQLLWFSLRPWQPDSLIENLNDPAQQPLPLLMTKTSRVVSSAERSNTIVPAIRQIRDEVRRRHQITNRDDHNPYGLFVKEGQAELMMMVPYDELTSFRIPPDLQSIITCGTSDPDGNY